MSKYKEITTQIYDRDHITAALDDLGVPHELAEPGQSLALNGYDRTQQAEVVVRRTGRLYGDFGWTMDATTGTYRLVVDDMDEARLRDIIQGVAQRCAFYRLQELAAENGFAVDALEGFETQRVVFVSR